MKVRAIATRSEASNAIGTVELECTPFGLVVVYFGVGSFTEGYAPGAVTTGTSVTVPWAGVLEARAHGDQLRLVFDPVLTPHNELMLANFSTGNAVDHRNVYRQRLMVRVAAAAVALVLLLTGWAALPRLGGGFTLVSALVIGAVAAGLIVVLGFAADHWIATGGGDSERTRQIFVSMLSYYLPSVAQAGPSVPAAPKPWKLPNFDGILPRTTGAIAITIASATLAAVLMAKWLSEPPAPEPSAHRIGESAPPELSEPEPSGPEPSAKPAPRPRPAAPAPAPARKGGPAAQGASEGHLAAGEACQCTRADSVLWRQSIAELTTLLIDSKIDRDGENPELILEVGAINNSDEPIEQLSMRVEFYEQDPPPSSKLYSVSNRPLYFQGPLLPGKAIKWRVQAQGTHFKIHPPTAGPRQEALDDTIGPNGERAAPTNLLADLLNANHRPVRLHGAMLLAFLNDPRAPDAARELRRALREEEATYLRRLLEAVAEVRACDLQVSASGEFSVCVQNTSAHARQGLGLQIKALGATVTHQDPVGPPPEVLEDWKWPLPVELGARSGVRVLGRVERTAERNAAMYEVVVDRLDLLN